MTIRQQGGVFGRNPTFNNVEADGTLAVSGQTIFNSDITIQNDNAPKISILDSNGGFAAATFTSENGGRDLAIFAPQDIIFDQNGLETARFLLGGGLTFNGDMAAANALNDYEEGTWTPVPADAASGGHTGTAGSVEGIYTKIGNTVFVQFGLLNINTTGLTAGNDFYIQGLPFSAGNTTLSSYAMGACITSGSISYTGEVFASVIDNTSAIRLAETVSGGNVDFVIVSELTSGGSDIWASLVYRTE